MKYLIVSILTIFVIQSIGISQTSTNVVLTKTLTGHTEPVSCLEFSPDGKIMASGSEAESLMSDSGKFEIIIWDAISNKILGHLTGHKDAIQSISFNKTGTKLVSSDSKGEVKIWDLTNFKEIKSITGSDWISTVCLTPDDRYIIGEYSYAKKVDLWDFETGELISTLNIGQQIGSMDISPDGSKIALSCYHSVQIWSLISNKKLLEVDDNSLRGFAIKYSPDGKILAVGSGDGEIKFFDPESLNSKYTLSGHFKPVLSVAFNKDSKYLISGSSDQMIKVWNLQSKKEIKSLVNVHKGMVKAVAFNPKSNAFATSGTDKTIKLWKIQ